jgi:hypothetical protein
VFVMSLLGPLLAVLGGLLSALVVILLDSFLK